MPLSCPDDPFAAHLGAEARKQVTSLSLSRIATRGPRSLTVFTPTNPFFLPRHCALSLF
jgi:hypothetical protein